MLSSYKDQDFYCSFTEFPNIDELPYTIHFKYSIEKMRSSTRRTKSYSSCVRSAPRTSFESKRSYSNAHTLSSSTSTRSKTSSLRSFFSSSTGSSASSRRRKLLSKMKQPFESMLPPAKHLKRRGGMLLQRHKKPSTLDFRCIGEEVCDGMFRVSTLNLNSFSSAENSPTSPRFSVVIYGGMYFLRVNNPYLFSLVANVYE